ncbi:carbohydrate ABC transporter permease [Nonomuraea sp. PA05]|uniref:carbohydrate ABC transporter permease n=1 Tax=Nonomuraea sp. PA05 TaxID=2604466 RepID=UPI0011D4C321|nr:carbohydrate ABC transporter permease [Nonomuraea sp. PA05]TYB62188.1 carbohydrate ABC transporter permease [Nonomuraea sp. PA05]
MTDSRSRIVVRSIVMTLLTVLMAIPLYYIVISTFKTPIEMATSPLGLPSSWTLDNYAGVFTTSPVVRSFANTLIVTVFGVAFQVLIGSLAAYGMILRRGRLTAAIGTLLMVAFCIPMQATLIPLYRMEAALGLVNSLTGLILIYLGGAIFCYFLIVGYMRKLPMSVLEAAVIDGAGPFRVYWTIVLPLIRPILTTVIVFQTLATWNDFLWPNILLSSSENRTIVLQVFNAVGQFSTDWPSFMTVTVIALVPVFVFFVLCQKWIVSGLSAGSIKG